MRGVAVLVFAALAVSCGASSSQGATSSSPSVARLPTPITSPSPKSSPALVYPPTNIGQARAVAAAGNAADLHEFHSEGVGLATCPQPKRELTVAATLTGRQLAEDMLAYFFDQKLNNDCGALVVVYHDESEAGGAYTAGRVILDVNNGMHSLEVDAQASDSFGGDTFKFAY